VEYLERPLKRGLEASVKSVGRDSYLTIAVCNESSAKVMKLQYLDLQGHKLY
jgi:hypothetical protein